MIAKRGDCRACLQAEGSEGLERERLMMQEREGSCRGQVLGRASGVRCRAERLGWPFMGAGTFPLGHRAGRWTDLVVGRRYTQGSTTS